MTKIQALEKIQALMSDLFMVVPESITESTSRENFPLWDSLQHVNVVMEIEGRFSVQLSPEEVESVRSVADVLKLLEARGIIEDDSA